MTVRTDSPLTGRTGRTGRTALIVAHPGHELRVHRWIECARPTVFVLTDGSGRTQRSRLPSTQRILDTVGAPRGSVFGWCTDGALYAALLANDVAFFHRTAETLVDALLALDAECIVGDALEGFNPSHDICRYLINLTVALLQERTGRAPASYDFLLDADPRHCPAELRASAIDVRLDEAALERKLTAAQNYPELRAEADAAIARYGTAPFRTECLRPVRDPRQGLDRLDQEPPYYERFGEQQVAAGHYRDVIRYRAHVRPLVHAVWRAAGLSPVRSDATASAGRG